MRPKHELQCLKITPKVAFNIASEASCVYFLSRQKFIKNAKNGRFGRVFENLKFAVKQCYQKVNFNWTKSVGKCQNSKIEMRLLGWFSNTVIRVLASFFLIDFCGQVFPRVDLHVHFPRFWWPHRPWRRSSIFLGTTPYCLRINCRRFTTSDSLLEGDYKKDLHCQEEAEMKVLFDIQNQFCRKM